MRIGFISDLHIDINAAYPVMTMLEKTCQEQELNMLVIAGDVSETPDRTIAAVKNLQERLSADTNCRVCYVPGNHDMWNKNCPEKSTQQIAEAYEEDPLCLAGGKVFLAGDYALIGDIGWYDYSFASPQYSRAELEGMQISGRTWQDKLFNRWTGDNAGQMRRSLERLRGAMEAAALQYGREKKLIAVTHMLPVREFCVPETQKDWGFFNAFLGGEAIGDLLKEYPVRFSVCGHVHYRKRLERDGITWICPCLGYHNEWPLYELADSGLQTHLENALQVFDLS